MGRQILLILGITLTTAAAAREQAPQEPVPPPVTEGAPSALPQTPAPLPDDIPPRQVSGATTESVNGADGKQNSRSRSQKKSDTRNAAANSDSRGTGEPPPLDPGVVRAQATAPPGPPVAEPAPGASDVSGVRLSAADRLPLGKQAVAVTVDVLAPTSMNLKKEATLKLIVRNTGIADAYNVQIDDELQEGFKFVSSKPDMRVSGNGQHLSLVLPLLTAGADKVITITVDPQKVGPFDHAATVRFETGCKTRTTVLQPRLKVDIVANPTGGKVLRGQQVEFNVSIHNTGDGPARNVAILAKLSPGLKHDSGPRADEQMVYELSIPELPQNATEKLDPLVADAILGGEQFCTVTAKSPDVVFEKEEAENTKRIEVVEPKLKIAIEGPEQRYTDTIADYKITLTNPGTAAARKIRVLATLPVNGVLVKKPRDAIHDTTASKLYWNVDQLEMGTKSMTFAFQVRVGGKGSYEVIADAVGEGALKDHGAKPLM